MKKFLPFAILGIGIVILVGAFFLTRNKKDVSQEEETAPEIPFESRPVASLTPTEDGHWLTMKIEKINLEAATLDYMLLYTLPDGRNQGVPGDNIKIQKGETIERKLLLGSESSGKFRYDEGVSEGTLTLKFRDDNGKLVGKLSTSFHLQSKVNELTSIDSQFKFLLDKTPTKDFFVTMETFGAFETLASTSKGPYGIFSSSKVMLSGIVNMQGDIYSWIDNKWTKLDGGKSSNIGIFASVSPQ
ncbi:MAG TPA: hypothetical protein VJ399_03180 [Patescibacteria group bacterium]|nr:hypothetical protein [Patescibacteria group bacterium]